MNENGFKKQYVKINGYIDLLKNMKKQAVKDSKIINGVKKAYKGKPKLLYNSIQRRYKIEQGEQLRSPDAFWHNKGDCDCQAIFYASYFLKSGYQMSDLYFVLAAVNNAPVHHVFLINRATGKKIFDPLPGISYNDKIKLNRYKVRRYYRLDSL